MIDVDPPVSRIRQLDTYRLVPSKHGHRVLASIADTDAHLREIEELDGATNDRLLAQSGLLPGIHRAELVSGVPFADIVNAAFTHAHPLGSRFNGPDRGAWYAAFKLQTAQREMAFHKTLELVEIRRRHDDVTYDAYLADLAGDYHDLRGAKAFAPCLSPDSYVASQTLAERLLHADSHGIVYPSVRDPRGGTCMVCFRPAAVTNVRKGKTYRFRWAGADAPKITELRSCLDRERGIGR